MHPASENYSLLGDMDSMTDDSGETGAELSNNHCHSLLLKNNENQSAERILKVVASLSALFIILEFTGGYLANSLSIMTEAGHILSDFLSFVISIASIRFARSPASQKFTFGLVRAEIVGALISVFIIWLLTVVLMIFATQRIINNQFEVEADTMIITAGLSVVFNIIVACFIRFSSGSIIGHAHGRTANNRSDELQVAHNVNVRAAFIHILGDFVQSVGVLLAAICIKIFKWELADPICTYLFSLIVLCTTMPLFKDIICIMMESTPNSTIYSNVCRELEAIEGVLQVHSLQIWMLNNCNTLAMSAHLVIDDKHTANAITITKKADYCVKKMFGIFNSAIQVEAVDEFSANCPDCQPLTEFSLT